MFRKLLALGLAAIFVGPSLGLITVATVLNPAATAMCVPGSLLLGPIPDALTATTRNG